MLRMHIICNKAAQAIYFWFLVTFSLVTDLLSELIALLSFLLEVSGCWAILSLSESLLGCRPRTWEICI